MRGHNRVSAELKWGEHIIEGRRVGYDTWEYPMKDFTGTSARSIKIPKLTKQYGGMRISFYPPQATIYVDGKMVSADNGVYLEARAEVGLHYVQARLMDYTSVRDSFTVESGKVYTRNYTLEPLALGIATITTDPEIGIYRRTAENELVFLGHSTFTGKIPAGENIIELKNAAGVTCQYHLFINNKEEHAPVTFPYERKLMVRTNVGKDITLKGEKRPAYQIKANKKMKLEPMKYEINVKKKGYQDYHDTIDLSQAGVSSLIYRADLRRLGDTIQTLRRPNRHLQRFYDRAGTWYLGVVDFGYNFDFNGGRLKEDGTTPDFRHNVTLGILPFRYKMFGMSLLDVEFCANDTAIIKTMAYKPKLSLFLPCDDGFAFHFYLGAAVNLYDAFHQDPAAASTSEAKKNIRTDIIGGASLRFNYVGKFPMDIFAEYKYPIYGIDDVTKKSLNMAQLFRVGISFSIGVDN